MSPLAVATVPASSVNEPPAATTPSFVIEPPAPLVKLTAGFTGLLDAPSNDIVELGNTSTDPSLVNELPEASSR